MRRAAELAAALALLLAPALGAQEGAPRAGDTVTVVPGAEYAAGGLHRFLFGGHYRTLWTTPLRVPVLDLVRAHGGLVPLRTGGGYQTRSLRLRGGDGREYAFRSVAKDPSRLLPEGLRGTVADEVLQDQISASHPVGALAAAPLLEAAGVRHATPVLVVLPDDPALGTFRAEFAGMLGLLEERPADDDGGKSIDTYKLLERLRERGERVAVEAFLAARLMDLFLGDWDRHADQWRWVRGDDGRWEPFPRDRDQAFARYDGVLLALARTTFPQFVSFGPRYPSAHGLGWNARVLDRRLLVPLERAAWDSVALALRARLTDSVIDAAVARLPGEVRARDGARLAADLRARRDRLPEAATALYRLLADQADLHLTEAAERVEAMRDADGGLTIVALAGSDTLVRRRFTTAETREVRLYLHRGDDAVRVTGAAGGPALRVIGGGGADTVRHLAAGGRTRLYDAGDRTTTEGRVHLDRSRWTDHEPTEATPYPPRDWGHGIQVRPVAGGGPDVGVVLGVGVTRFSYGFRRVPWASRQTLRLAWAAGANAVRAEYLGEWRHTGSRLRTQLLARASGIEVLRYHGAGNASEGRFDDGFYRVRQSQYLLAPALVIPSGRAEFRVGPELKHTATRLDLDRLVGRERPYGSDGFTQLGVRGELALDTRDVAAHPTRGVHALLGAAFVPGVLDARESFASVRAEAATYLSARGLPLRPTLALRLGGAWVGGGDYPFFESAYVGGRATVRGLREQRYAGDASLFANVELRGRVGVARLVLPSEWGLLAFQDVGRVFLEGERSRDWHAGAGAGLWVAPVGLPNTFSVAVARSEGRTGFYVRAGMMF